MQHYRVCRRGELVCAGKAGIHTRGENPRDKGLLCEDELHPLYKHIHHKSQPRYKAAHARNGKAVPRYELHYYSRNAPERRRREHFKHGLGFLFHRVPVSAVGNDGYRSALDDPERENAEKALRVDTSVFLFNPNAALEFIGFLNEESRGSGMKTYLIVNDYFFGYHTCHSLY